MRSNLKYRLTIGDLFGGIAGSAVVLPQAIGLGVLLFSAMGFSAKEGALAGIIGLIILNLVVGLAGATIGIFSAPNGPMTMLLLGVLGGLYEKGVDSQTLILTLSLILVLTGIFQIIFAFLGGTSIIKYIPYPVIAGLIAGVGIGMVFSQISLLEKEVTGSKLPDTPEEIFLFIIALVTMGLMWLTPRLSKGKIPPAVGALFGGSLIFFTLLKLLPIHFSNSWVVGALPSIDNLNFGLELNESNTLPLLEIIASALALTVLGTIDSLVTSLVADSKTGFRHDSKKEIMAQGSAEILIGLLGGLGGWGTKGATIVATEAGGRRWAPIIASLFILFLLFFASYLASYLPTSVLAGIIAMVGIGMIDKNIFAWLKYKTTRVDGYIAILVALISLSVSLVTAVAIGMGIAMLIFLYKEARRPIIHRYSTGLERRSNCRYPKKAIELLDSYGDEFAICELKGELFFGTAERLRQRLEAELAKKKMIILHLRRVTSLDLSAMIVLLQLGEEAKKLGCKLIYCHLHDGLGFGRKIKKAFRHIDSRYSFNYPILADGDSALEYAERDLLKRHGWELQDSKEVAPFDNDMFDGLNKEQINALLNIAIKKSVGQGEKIFKRGKEGESIYLILKGSVELRLKIAKKSYKRVAKYEAGAYFGELAFIKPAKREADAVAIEDTKLLKIRHSDLMSLDKSMLYDLSLALLSRFSLNMSSALRRANQEIKRLEEW